MSSDVGVEFNNEGAMRIRIGELRGKFQDYHDVATLTLEVNGNLESYIAVTEYGLGQPLLAPGKVYRVIPL